MKSAMFIWHFVKIEERHPLKQGLKHGMLEECIKQDLY